MFASKVSTRTNNCHQRLATLNLYLNDAHAVVEFFPSQRQLLGLEMRARATVLLRRTAVFVVFRVVNE